MREISVNSQRSTSTSPAQRLMDFHGALRVVAAHVGAKDIHAAGTPISTFRANYAAILERVEAGALEVVTRRGEPFVILSLEQVLALATDVRRNLTAADLLKELPSAPKSDGVPRVRHQVLAKSHHRVPR